jgi:hypothetical protein
VSQSSEFAAITLCIASRRVFIVTLVYLFIYDSVRKLLDTSSYMHTTFSTKVYPKVAGLAAWSENRKWYSFLPLGAVVSLFCEAA